MKDCFEEMERRWPSGIVSRTEVPKFTGGLLSSKYMANLDSQGTGPLRIRVGRKVGYPVKDFVNWLRSRSY